MGLTKSVSSSKTTQMPSLPEIIRASLSWFALSSEVILPQVPPSVARRQTSNSASKCQPAWNASLLRSLTSCSRVRHSSAPRRYFPDRCAIPPSRQRTWPTIDHRTGTGQSCRGCQGILHRPVKPTATVTSLGGLGQHSEEHIIRVGGCHPVQGSAELCHHDDDGLV
jgi:hypothetical protein